MSKLKAPFPYFGGKSLVADQSLLVLALLCLGSLAVVGWIWYRFYFEPDLSSSTYESYIRQSLFTGFLTLGGFLLSMKTFVLANVKKDVYDSEAFTKFMRELAADGINLNPYEALYQLQTGLTFSICFSLFASASQFTLGVLRSWWGKPTACTLAALALAFVLWSVWLLYTNTKVWLDYASKDREERDEKEREDARRTNSSSEKELTDSDLFGGKVE